MHRPSPSEGVTAKAPTTNRLTNWLWTLSIGLMVAVVVGSAVL